MRVAAACAVLITTFGGYLSLAQADNNKGSINDQLLAAYPVVQLSQDKLSVTAQGTIFIVNKPDIATASSPIAPVSTYKDGQIKEKKSSTFLMMGQKPEDLHAGDRVYLVRVEVKEKDSTINFTVQRCDPCDYTPITSGVWRGVVQFVFPKGALSSPDMSRIQQTIAEVFTPATTAPPATAPTATDAAANSQQSAGPTAIRQGETPAEVVSAMGEPVRKAAVGSKEIWFYKDMKITFENGKLTDVQ